MSELQPDQAETLAQFLDVTGATESLARFHLEASHWSLQAALAHFYENNGGEDSDEIEEIAPPSNPNASQDGKSDSKSRTQKFATVASLNKESSSDEEEGQAFFAGGSTTSGQQVLGPGKKKSNIVAEMFKTVQEHGGEVVENVDGKKPKTLTFAGTGYRLGQTPTDTQVIPSPGASEGRREVTITLKMWREGFSIDDGPLRKYSDPESRTFLNTVGRGEIPEELLREARSREVHLNMEDHSHEEYVVVKPKLKAFTGKGNVLGSPVPSNEALPPPSDASTREAGEAAAKALANVDEAQPQTSVQIRLADGSRLVATLNHTHTIADLRCYITTSRPEYADQSFRLLTAFPSKELADDRATLSEAGILNASIIQRL